MKSFNYYQPTDIRFGPGRIPEIGELAAEQGYAPAQNNIGMMYGRGLGVSADFTQALRWFSMAAEQDHSGAQFNIGYMYENGLGVARDIEEAVRWYRLAADRGNRNAFAALRRLGIQTDPP